MSKKGKEALYENVRNMYSEVAPIIESTGALMVNPNTWWNSFFTSRKDLKQQKCCSCYM